MGKLLNDIIEIQLKNVETKEEKIMKKIKEINEFVITSAMNNHIHIEFKIIGEFLTYPIFSIHTFIYNIYRISSINSIKNFIADYYTNEGFEVIFDNEYCMTISWEKAIKSELSKEE